MRTKGFIGEVDPDIGGRIIAYAIEYIKPSGPTMVVFDPQCKKMRKEDSGRTLIRPTEATQTIYAKLDDYHSPETLSENLGRKVATQYVITFLLAEEY